MTTTTTTTSRAAGAPDRRTCFSPASGSGPRGDLRLSLLKKRVEGVQKFLKSSVPEFITNNCATKYEGDNEKKTSENTTTTTKRREKRLRKPMRSILTASISEQNSINKNKNNKMNSETTAAESETDENVTLPDPNSYGFKALQRRFNDLSSNKVEITGEDIRVALEKLKFPASRDSVLSFMNKITK